MCQAIPERVFLDDHQDYTHYQGSAALDKLQSSAQGGCHLCTLMHNALQSAIKWEGNSVRQTPLGITISSHFLDEIEIRAQAGAFAYITNLLFQVEEEENGCMKKKPGCRPPTLHQSGKRGEG